MADPSILIVEDEEKIRSILRAYLLREGYQVEEAATGDSAVAIFEDGRFDLVLLDLMLPGMPGEEVAAIIRQKSDVPILMLTAKGEEWDRLRGFELGADDYVVKPFSPREVVARIRTILKRAGKGVMGSLDVLELDILKIDPNAREVFVDGKLVKLTATEFDLLYEMAAHPGVTYRRSKLASIVLGYDYEAYERTIDSHIKNLRKKLGSVGKMVETVFGVGYKIVRQEA